MTARKLTERDWEVLETLFWMRYESSCRHLYEGGTAPLDFGGSNGSHHGATASKLAKRGLVDQKYRGLDWNVKARPSAMMRGSKLYRISEAGRDAVLARRELRELEKKILAESQA